MAQKQGGKGKKKRDKKVSLGKHGGGGKVRNLTEVQKVNMGKGFLDMPIDRYPVHKSA